MKEQEQEQAALLIQALEKIKGLHFFDCMTDAQEIAAEALNALLDSEKHKHPETRPDGHYLIADFDGEKSIGYWSNQCWLLIASDRPYNDKELNLTVIKKIDLGEK